MRLKMSMIAIIIFTVILGGIAITMAADIWSTISDKIPAKFKEGEYAGKYNPEDIRGSYTFEEVSELFEIDLQVLYQAFGIDKDTDGTQIKTKDLENLYQGADVEIGNGSVQAFVALYKNLPITLDGVYLPKHAVDIILEANRDLTQAQKDYLERHQVELKENSLSSETADGAESEEKENSVEENLVKGKTTFQQVLDAGIAEEKIEAIIGKDLPPTNQTIKDYCVNEGLSFSTVKDQLNKLME